MSLLSFFVRRAVTGAVARRLSAFLARRFKMSPGMANIVFVILTELLARSTEKPSRFPQGGFSAKGRAKRP